MALMRSISALATLSVLFSSTAEASCKNEDTEYLCYRVTRVGLTESATSNYGDRRTRVRFDLKWVNATSLKEETLEESTIYSSTLNGTDEDFVPNEAWCQVVDWAQEPANKKQFDIFVYVRLQTTNDASDDDATFNDVAVWRSERIEEDFKNNDLVVPDTWYEPNDDSSDNRVNTSEYTIVTDWEADVTIWMQKDSCLVVHNMTVNDTATDWDGNTYHLWVNVTSGKEMVNYDTVGTQQGSTSLTHTFDLIACPMRGSPGRVYWAITNETGDVILDIDTLPKKKGVSMIELETPWKGTLDDTYDVEEDHMYSEYRKCPGDPYAAVARALQLTFIILLAILAGFGFFVFAGALYAKFNQFDGMDAIRYFNVIWIFIEIYKFVSDLGFMILLSTRDQTIPFFVLVFLVTLGLYVSNVLYLAHLIEVWTNDSAPKHTREWILEHKWFLYALTLGLGGMHPALEITNSLLFPIPIFAMHVPYAEIMRVRSERSSTMVLENFPLMVLQFVYFLLIPDLQSADFVFWNAVAASMLSAFISTIYFFTKAEIEEKPIIATHQFTVSSTGGYQDFMEHCHWNMQKAIALSAGVKPVQVMVEDLSVKSGTAVASGRIILDIEQAHGDHTHGDKDLEEQMAKHHEMQTPSQAQANAPAYLKRKFHLSEEPKVNQFDITQMANGQQPVYIRETRISKFFEDLKERTVALWEKANVTDEKQWGTSQGRPKDMRVKSMSGVGSEGDDGTTGGTTGAVEVDGEGEAGAATTGARYGEMEMVVSTTAPGSPRPPPIPTSPKSTSQASPRPPPSPVSPRPPPSPIAAKRPPPSPLSGKRPPPSPGTTAEAGERTGPPPLPGGGLPPASG